MNYKRNDVTLFIHPYPRVFKEGDTAKLDINIRLGVIRDMIFKEYSVGPKPKKGWVYLVSDKDTKQVYEVPARRIFCTMEDIKSYYNKYLSRCITVAERRLSHHTYLSDVPWYRGIGASSYTFYKDLVMKKDTFKNDIGNFCGPLINRMKELEQPTIINYLEKKFK